MRLLTHNQLTCAKKGCQNAFPLQIAAVKVVQDESECNPQFIGHIVGRVDYPALVAAAASIGLKSLPPQLPEWFIKQSTVKVVDAKQSNASQAAAKAKAGITTAAPLPSTAPAASASGSAAGATGDSMALAEVLHTALLRTRVISGGLVCPKCSRLYPIEQGIPNMRLKDDEL